MEKFVPWITMAATIATLIGGFASMWMRLGRVEFKIDTMWEWYVKHQADARPGGRRRYDPPAGELE